MKKFNLFAMSMLAIAAFTFNSCSTDDTMSPTTGQETVDGFYNMTIHDDDSSLEPVTVSFYFESAGQVHRIVMPLLLIVPVPYLQIDRVDLTFQATVTESRMNHDTRKLSL